jgi:hypothetical protein
MRKSWNPFGEGEDGMLKSAWETTGGDRARSRERHKDKQGSREYVLEGCTATTVRYRRRTNKRAETLSKKVKSKNHTEDSRVKQ